MKCRTWKNRKETKTNKYVASYAMSNHTIDHFLFQLNGGSTPVLLIRTSDSAMPKSKYTVKQSLSSTYILPLITALSLWLHQRNADACDSSHAAKTM